MTYAKGTIRRYLKDLASRTPAPGGGSSAALSVAVAAALIRMAASYAAGKKGLEAFASRARAIQKKAGVWQERSLKLMDADVAAYRAQDAVRSVRVPVEVCRIAEAEAEAAYELMTRGNKYLTTDAAFAVYLSAAAYIAASGYIEVNLKYFKDKVRRFKGTARTLKARRLVMKRLMSRAEAYLG